MKIPIVLGLIAVVLLSVVVGSGFYISTLNDDDSLPTPIDNFDYYYDSFSGVELFDEGVYAIATSEDLVSQFATSSFSQSYWSLMQQNITNKATDQDFISILISRGDKPTGGYGIAVESFSWLESYPVKFRFAVNITDPGEDVIVSQALTNPLVLVPIGKLSAGEYQIEVNVVWFIQNFDSQGNVEYQPVMTFKEIVWTQNLTVTTAKGTIPTVTFEVNVNQNAFPDFIVAADLTNPVTKELAQKIADAVFVHVKGENTLYQLNSITFSNKEIIADYNWGYNQEDMSHVFELNLDLVNHKVDVIHCL